MRLTEELSKSIKWLSIINLIMAHKFNENVNMMKHLICLHTNKALRLIDDIFDLSNVHRKFI